MKDLVRGSYSDVHIDLSLSYGQIGAGRIAGCSASAVT